MLATLVVAIPVQSEGDASNDIVDSEGDASKDIIVDSCRTIVEVYTCHPGQRFGIANKPCRSLAVHGSV